MKYIYKASRHHAPIRATYDTLKEAIERAASDHDHGEAYPEEITAESGTVVLDHDELHAMFSAS